MKLGFVSTLLLLAGCSSVDVSIQPHENAKELESLSYTVFTKVNAHRLAKNLSELKLDLRLSKIARGKSAAMAQGGEFSHVGFNVVRAGQIKIIIPFRRAGENLAFNTNEADPAARAVKMWQESPSHLANMERPEYSITGIGVAKSVNGQIYFTQLFVNPK